MSKSPQKKTEKHPSHHDENEWIKKVSTYKTSQMSSDELGQIMRQHSMYQRSIQNSKNLTKSKKGNKLDSLEEIFNISEIEKQFNNEKEDEFYFSIYFYFHYYY